MPRSNIVFIKLQLELLWDYRFSEELNDRQKLLYLELLLLSGKFENRISKNRTFLKRLLNSESDLDTIDSDITHLLKVFPKLKDDNGFLTFLNFEEIHNYTISKSKGIRIDAPEEEQEEEKEKEVDSSFEKLWLIYPRRDGKKQAFSHYKRAFKKGFGGGVEKALKNYIGYVEAEKVEPRFIKVGSTFFNNWEDWEDYEPPKPKIISRTQLMP